MSSSPDLPRLNRFVQGLWLCAGGGGVGALIGALEGRWIAHRGFIPLAPFDHSLISICIHYIALFATAGLLLGWAHYWRHPSKVLCALTFLGAAWVLPYQSSAIWVTVGGLAFCAVGCALFLRSSPRLRRLYYSLGAFLFLALLAGFPDPEPKDKNRGSPDSPNIVLVVIDTLRADALSSYRESPRTKDVSPVIDSIVKQGVRFGNAYAQAPWTRPSTASLFTGLYPASHGIVTPFDPLNDALPTMASMLKERGYQTIGFSANPQISAAFGFHNGFDRFWSSTARLKDRSAGIRLLRKWGIGKVEKQPARGVLHSTADDVNRAVGTWLAEKPAAAPAFLYIHYLDPHDPYTAPQDLLGEPPLTEVEEAPLYASQELPPYPLMGSSLPGLNPLELRELQRRYDTEIRFVDDRLGKMLESLRVAGILRDQDYLIITSDHGEEFYDHQQWQHGRSLFEEMIHVPLIVIGPKIPAESVVQHPVELVDVLPTVAAWTGAPPRFAQHGENLFGKKKKVGAFSHRPRQQHPIWSLRVANQKVIWIQSGDEMVKLAFDLTTDPHEAHPLDAEGGESFFGLHERLEELINSSSEYRRAGSGSMELDPNAAQNLEQLGYIDGAEEN
ncbi:MAG: sulfatase [Planctomycetota bacterium]